MRRLRVCYVALPAATRGLRHARELAGNAPYLTQRGYLGQVPVDLDERALGDYPDHRRTRDHGVAHEELAAHHDASSVDFLHIKDPDVVLESTALQLLDPPAKTFVAVVRAAGAPGSGWMKLDLRLRDRDEFISVPPVECFSKPTSKRLGQRLRHHLHHTWRWHADDPAGEALAVLYNGHVGLRRRAAGGG